MPLNLTTPVLKLPALGWVFLCLSFWIIVLALGPPAELPPPEGVEMIFRDHPVVVTSVKGNFEIVDDTDKKPGQPYWYILPYIPQEEKTPVQWLFGWDGKRFNLGLYKMHSRWNCELNSVRCDDDPYNPRSGPLVLPAETMQKIRPLLIDDLNRRFEKEQAGAWFDKVLETGMEEESYLCPQNVCIVIAWLLLLPALYAVVAMFTVKTQSSEPPA